MPKGQKRLCATNGCGHMISMHSIPKLKNGQTRPCFFTGCHCEDFTDMSNETPQVVDKTRASEIVVDAALGGLYEKIGEAIREAGYEDSSGFRREIASKIYAGRFAEVASLLNISEPEARARFGAHEAVAPRVVDKRRFTNVDLVSDAEPEVDFTDDLPSAFSPSSEPRHVPGMDFGTALKEVIKGHRVTRLEWENPETWLMMFYWGQINPNVPAGKYLSIHHANGQVSPLYANDGDMMAEDWVVVS